MAASDTATAASDRHLADPPPRAPRDGLGTVFDGIDETCYGFPDIDGRGAKAASHRRGRVLASADDLRQDGDAADEVQIRRGLVPLVPAADGPLLRMQTCIYTRAPEDFFVVDRTAADPRIVLFRPRLQVRERDGRDPCRSGPPGPHRACHRPFPHRPVSGRTGPALTRLPAPRRMASTARSVRARPASARPRRRPRGSKGEANPIAERAPSDADRNVTGRDLSRAESRHRRIDGQFQRRIVVGLKGCICEA